ncbi:dihydrolipoamide acetyltransferase component of pyruvate dehydrogenase complex [Yeosuana aromativorans]|uniref:Dihydrolipoamide acetyltransferase component of pyruvate dehydrogenase complex n=1 Tax=Yeosuana aromativorans TaxID=288019 RepID=A0A8J3FDG1_9FLAO|nr:dihydrolipoamide acetyltransferase family protein [Yeosuana aromativorans]GGK10003.1 dihydrolipoamide acetyltransferase component of pyruvate dehydrogenase complex [Yeosuana aromativorans]
MSKFELRMPKMGESITEATILNWLVKEGDSFEEGDIILEIGTDKVDNELPAPCSGKLIETKAQINDVVPIGSVIAILEVTKETSSAKKGNVTSSIVERSQNDNEIKEQKPVQVSFPPLGEMSKRQRENTFFSPLIISIAKTHHISFEELVRIPATGTDGRLRKSDVFQYINDGRPYKFAQPLNQDPTVFRIPQLQLDKGTGRIVEMDRMRKMIADHMVYSKHTSPHVTAYVEADVTNMVQWREDNKTKFQKQYSEKLTFTPLFVEAVAKAIKEYPNINASVDGDNIIIKDHINIGMASALPSGNLIVPVIKDADRKELNELAREVNELSEKARDNKLKGDDLKGGTFTISNVGTFGSLMGTPIINQPEVAILALGIIKKRPEVITTKKGDEIAIRSMMYLSLSFDHRVVDGFLGGSFLRRVADYLEQFDINREF